MSKGLEALDTIAYSYGYDENIAIIQKELKALDVIKEKEILLWWIFLCFKYGETQTEKDYNTMFTDRSKKLTQKEYELLKGVLQ